MRARRSAPRGGGALFVAVFVLDWLSFASGWVFFWEEAPMRRHLRAQWLGTGTAFCVLLFARTRVLQSQHRNKAAVGVTGGRQRRRVGRFFLTNCSTNRPQHPSSQLDGLAGLSAAAVNLATSNGGQVCEGAGASV